MKREVNITQQKKTPIIILHGWAKIGDDYRDIKKIFEEKGYQVFAPDLPGFGEQKLTKSVMVLNDYGAFVYDFIKKHKIKKVILIGHSFGGRIAAKFTATYPELVEKLIITGSPLIRRKLSFKKKVIATVAKTGKRVLSIFPERATNILRKVLYRSIGEWDYYKAGELRETFVHIINEDVSLQLPKITVPTLLIWGEKETFVPVIDGQEIAQRIPKATFILVQGATHKLPYENPQEFARAVLSFLS